MLEADGDNIIKGIGEFIIALLWHLLSHFFLLFFEVFPS